MKKNKPFILLKVINKKGEVIKKVLTSKSKRIFYLLQAGNFEDHTFFVKVTYNFEKGYKNGGEYKIKKDLINAMKAFTEPALVKEFIN